MSAAAIALLVGFVALYVARKKRLLSTWNLIEPTYFLVLWGYFLKLDIARHRHWAMIVLDVIVLTITFIFLLMADSIT